MPPPIHVRLVPHDLGWAARAEIEAARIREAAGATMARIHHIGSTAVPGIAAKPILDLLGVVRDLAAFDRSEPSLVSIGYACHGEYGLPGRRYCRLDDADTGERLVQLHCYAQGDPAIIRHLAFRDHLRLHSEVAAAYEREKARCAALHPNDSHAYADCKDVWIKRVEGEALKALSSRRGVAEEGPTR